MADLQKAVRINGGSRDGGFSVAGYTAVDDNVCNVLGTGTDSPEWCVAAGYGR